MKMKRRDFLKYSIRGVATVVVGSRIIWLKIPEALAAVQTLNITITDAMKEMATHNAINTARCYFWIYKMKADDKDIPAECPGPNIIIAKGDTVNITIKNDLDEPHAGQEGGPPIIPGKPRGQ